MLATLCGLSRALLILTIISLAAAASSWVFEDATISIHGKKAGVGAGHKEKFGTIPTVLRSSGANISVHRLVENKALSRPVTLGGSDTLKVLLTAKEDKKAKRPHQAFLRLEDRASGLETSYALAVKDNGKGKLEFVGSPSRSRSNLLLIPVLDSKGSSSSIVDSFWSSFCVSNNSLIWLVKAIQEPRFRSLHRAGY